MTVVVATRLVWTVVGVLVVVNMALLAWGQVDTPTTMTTGGWGAWAKLSSVERQELFQRYRALVRQPNTARILRDIRAYERLSEGERQRLGELARLLEETIAAQPPQGRRELLLAPPGAQAFHVYRILMQSGARVPSTAPAAP
jgi:hypothetical protein